MKWQYMFEGDVTLDRLNALGSEGWELVGVFPRPAGRHQNGTSVTPLETTVGNLSDFESRPFPVTDGRFVFKRQQPESS